MNDQFDAKVIGVLTFTILVSLARYLSEWVLINLVDIQVLMSKRD